jgi:thymidylate synthase ThyX
MAYEDAKHRPHAIHTGEEPRNPITYGPESLSVRLDRWGPVDNLFTSMYDALQANWGESPSRTVLRNEGDVGAPDDRVPEIAGGIGGAQNYFQRTGWSRLYEHERDYVESCFAGKTLQQVLEGVTFDFCIDGVSRAFTHQNVRTRLGAGFMQHGGRDNDWRHRPWTMPETMRRMCDAHSYPGHPNDAPMESNFGQTLQHCISDWLSIDAYLDSTPQFVGFSDDIKGRIEQHIMTGRRLYGAMVDAGIPWQDARRVLFMGMQTYIHDQYNYLALSGVLANRLEHIMDWEFNCVAQLMLREIKMKCPPLLSKYLGSHSDKARQAKFAGLESWPPDGKYPNPYERCSVCGHSKGNHHMHPDTNDVDMCEACERGAKTMIDDPTAKGPLPTNSLHKYEGEDTLQRQHRSEQMPFFVLHPDSMAGGEIVWIPTNGQYPHDVIR